MEVEAFLSEIDQSIEESRRVMRYYVVLFIQENRKEKRIEKVYLKLSILFVTICMLFVFLKNY